MDPDLVDHAENPRNVGAFPEGTPGMTKALTNEPACGDVLKLQLIVSPEGVVTDPRRAHAKSMLESAHTVPATTDGKRRRKELA